MVALRAMKLWRSVTVLSLLSSQIMLCVTARVLRCCSHLFLSAFCCPTLCQWMRVVDVLLGVSVPGLPQHILRAPNRRNEFTPQEIKCAFAAVKFYIGLLSALLEGRLGESLLDANTVYNTLTWTCWMFKCFSYGFSRSSYVFFHVFHTISPCLNRLTLAPPSKAWKCGEIPGISVLSAARCST